MPDPSPFAVGGTTGGASYPTGTPPESGSLLQSAQDAASAVADRARDVASSVADTTEQIAGRVRDTATDAWETSSEYVGDQYDNLTRWVQRNPRTALCLGFAAGCCIGYLLVTMRER
jgi:hypothetical protein